VVQVFKALNAQQTLPSRRIAMKIAILIARIMLGLLFTIFGLNNLFHFIHMQIPPGDAGTLLGLMFEHGWFAFIGILMVIAGVLLLVGRYIGIALTILGPIIVVILLYHITLAPQAIGMGLFAALLEIFLIYAYRHHFGDIFSA
jgi:putative oxidoreductase